MSSATTRFFQFPPHRISNTDNLRTGTASAAGRQVLGVPLAGAEAQAVICLGLGAPATASANAAATSQSVTAGNAFLLNGALASGGVVTFDVPRNIVGAWTTSSILTITGKDEYGQTMTEVTPSAASFTGKKAYKQITSITSSASITVATIGTGVLLGLPYRPVVGGFVSGILGENTADAGTYAAPERVASTTSTNDVRGTYSPAAAPNGTNAYAVRIAVQNGPNDSDGFGITQA